VSADKIQEPWETTEEKVKRILKSPLMDVPCVEGGSASKHSTKHSYISSSSLLDMCRLCGRSLLEHPVYNPKPKLLLPVEATERKKFPIGTGVLDYFPAAIAEVSNVSFVGNEQHNPGEPLHWARGKSTDQEDTMMRHYLERGTRDVDGQRHSAKMVWRALAILQLELEADGAPIARGSQLPEESK
jgi:hypothetical protein